MVWLNELTILKKVPETDFNEETSKHTLDGDGKIVT